MFLRTSYKSWEAVLVKFEPHTGIFNYSQTYFWRVLGLTYREYVWLSEVDTLIDQGPGGELPARVKVCRDYDRNIWFIPVKEISLGLGLLNTQKHCFLNFTRQYLFIIYSGATLKVPWWAKILTFPPQDFTRNQSLSFISLSETRNIPPPFYTGVSASPSTTGKGIEKQGTYLAGSIQNLCVSAQSTLTSN